MKKVLIVDDQLVVRELVEMTLRGGNYQILQFMNQYIRVLLYHPTYLCEAPTFDRRASLDMDLNGRVLFSLDV